MDYEKLYKTYFMQVYSFVMTIVRNQPAAEEITQNTFFKAMTSKKRFEGRSGELTYLCSIAKNLAADEFRRGSRHAALDEMLPDSNADFTYEAEDKGDALRIHRILHELNEPYKEVFQLRVFGELSFAQIGQIFAKTESWARVTYHRARLKIKERMNADG